MDRSTMAVLAGNANPQLAHDIARHLMVPLGRVAVSRFSDSETTVELLENVRGRDVFIVQPTCPPSDRHLMELLMMLDAARGASAARITAVIPHYAYARSDKKDAPRISIGGRLVADLIDTAGANRVLTMALHSPQVHGFFSVPVDHLNALNVIADHFRQTDLANAIVVSPDLGNAKAATQFARLLGLSLPGDYEAQWRFGEQ